MAQISDLVRSFSVFNKLFDRGFDSLFFVVLGEYQPYNTITIHERAEFFDDRNNQLVYSDVFDCDWVDVMNVFVYE